MPALEQLKRWAAADEAQMIATSNACAAACASLASLSGHM
jgi:hypothetical protein